MKDSSGRTLPEALQQVFRLVRDAASARQTSNNLSLIVRDRELVE